MRLIVERFTSLPLTITAAIFVVLRISICRIGVQQDYIASLPHLNRALQGFTSKKYVQD